MIILQTVRPPVLATGLRNVQSLLSAVTFVLKKWRFTAVIACGRPVARYRESGIRGPNRPAANINRYEKMRTSSSLGPIAVNDRSQAANRITIDVT